MKSDTRSATHTHSGRIAAAALAMAITAMGLASTTRADDTPPAPKGQVLFKGTDFLVSQGGDYFRLVGVDEKGLQVIMGRKPGVIAQSSVTGIKFVRGEKLTDLSASISNLQSTTIPASDRRGEEPTAISTMAAPTIEGIEGPTDGLVVSGSPSGSGAFFDRFGYQQDVLVTFEISAQRPLAHAFVAVVIGYSDSRKGSPLLCKIAVRPVEDLGPKSRKIRIVQSGMPRRFDLKGTDVKVYAEGREVATNLLKQQVPLTRQEAHAYFVKRYVSSHAGETAPPGLLILVPATTLVRQLSEPGLDEEIYVTVNADGEPTKVAADESGARKVSDQTASLLRHIGFMPALENGVPVQGTLKLNPATLLK